MKLDEIMIHLEDIIAPHIEKAIDDLGLVGEDREEIIKAAIEEAATASLIAWSMQLINKTTESIIEREAKEE